MAETLDPRIVELCAVTLNLPGTARVIVCSVGCGLSLGGSQDLDTVAVITYLICWRNLSFHCIMRHRSCKIMRRHLMSVCSVCLVALSDAVRQPVYVLEAPTYLIPYAGHVQRL